MTDLAAVARRAGVSPATASRVLSGRGPASAESRRRVEAAAAELGYAPHPVARLLARGRGTRVVLAVRDARPGVLADPFVARATAAVAAVTDEHGLGVALRHLPLDSEHALADLAADRGVAAVVTIGQDEGAPPRARTAAIGPGGCDVDSAAGIEALLRHLYASGRRRIAMITGPGWLAAARAPRTAYARFTRSAGLPSRTVTGDFSAARGREAAGVILRRWPDTDAVVTVSDATALGALAGLAGLGARVPADVAVTGFDDVPLAAAVPPGLTTATHPVERIAAAACRAALAGRGDPELFPSRPVLRGTCGGTASTA